MSYYMYQASIQILLGRQSIKPPESFRYSTSSVENLGGKLETAFYCFGEYDIIFICIFPR
ncbi:MAG: hypothetical protein CM1200mP37_6980 [Chloroflexota bacterium]|nr:MAG: hypothetical protein CM1200mP37_6980 [Chloroflexota bacterium]